MAALILRHPSTFAQVYDQHAPSVYAGALRLVGNVQAAEQMVERAFLALWRNPEPVRRTDQGIPSYRGRTLRPEADLRHRVHVALG